MAINLSPAPLNNRAAVVASPGQYATPRRLTAAGAVNFQRTRPVSGSSEMTSLPAVTYIMPPTTSGVTSIPLTPVSYDHAGCSFDTFAGVICVSGENRCPPAS